MLTARCARLRALRRRAVFQDPLASLDPRRTVAESVCEPLDRLHPGQARHRRVVEVVDLSWGWPTGFISHDLVDERERRRIIVEGDVLSPVDPPSGCVFRTRRPLAIEECARHVPTVTLGEGHVSNCVRAGERVPV